MLRNEATTKENPTVTAASAPTRRERARAATIDEIKRTALDLMHEQQTTDIRFTDIARVMGMTAPALYRYYADRDELLTELITDAYADLGARIATAREAVPDKDIGGRWVAAASAYREWARSEPQRFALVLGMPVPGYKAPDEGPTTEAAAAAMAELSQLFIAAALAGRLRRPMIRDASAEMDACLRAKHVELEGIVPPETFQAMLQAWASLHGITSLETYGHLDWLEPPARDALFVSHVQMIAKVAGLPVPS
jgi:AcrR family transcriptional regulator